MQQRSPLSIAELEGMTLHNAITCYLYQTRSQTVEQECLSLVGLYNKYMQGVDRHDQLRERFSIASGASFKQWYKKLGFALIDIAITNLYVLYTICEPVNRRDSHLHFQTKLANQMLFETDWTL